MAYRTNRHAGDFEARSQRMVEECYDEVYAYCRRHARSREDAQDFAQEAFLRFARRYGAGDACERPLACLISIARNLCIDAVRRSPQEMVPLDDALQPAAPQASPETLAASDDGRIAGALASLDDEAREALELRFGCDLQVNEVARVLGVSRFSAMRRIKRGLAAVKECVASGAGVGGADSRCIHGGDAEGERRERSRL